MRSTQKVISFWRPNSCSWIQWLILRAIANSTMLTSIASTLGFVCFTEADCWLSWIVKQNVATCMTFYTFFILSIYYIKATHFVTCCHILFYYSWQPTVPLSKIHKTEGCSNNVQYSGVSPGQCSAVSGVSCVHWPGLCITPDIRGITQLSADQ